LLLTLVLSDIFLVLGGRSKVESFELVDGLLIAENEKSIASLYGDLWRGVKSDILAWFFYGDDNNIGFTAKITLEEIAILNAGVFSDCEFFHEKGKFLPADNEIHKIHDRGTDQALSDFQAAPLVWVNHLVSPNLENLPLALLISGFSQNKKRRI